MSKKTRKKSSTATGKATPRTAAAEVTRGRVGAPAKKPAAKARTAVARKPGKAVQGAASKASHKAPSKPLKSERSAATQSGATLSEGAKAPSFRLPRDGGERVSSADYAGRKLVLFFYPRADTPGCTKEASDFTRLKAAFAETNTAVLGISADSVKAQESFRNKYQLSIPLISDEQHTALLAYGAWGKKSMYGKEFEGVLRTTVLIGADGRIAKIWRNVRVDGHADEVLAAARGL